VKLPRRIYFRNGADVPNNNLPVLLFRSVLAPKASGKGQRFRQTFKENCWTGLWIDTIYDYTHFHSNAHEVLGIAEGRVTIKLGGEEGRLFRLKAGDMVILPAGVGHRRVGDDEGLKVVGAYPPGQSHFDMKRKGRVVPKVPVPLTDPFYGEDGPLVQVWAATNVRAKPTRKKCSH
jgi:uncharacterized protein YjlB